MQDTLFAVCLTHNIVKLVTLSFVIIFRIQSSLFCTVTAETDTDMDLMLSCLEEASEDVIIQALQTISTMCNNLSKLRIMACKWHKVPLHSY